jgi:hypothetical protein
MILLLTTLLVAVMPATENYWTWDHFISSGHDFEFSLLGVLVFCGLVALIAHQVIASPLFLLMIAHHLKAPPIRRVINLAIEKIPGMVIDFSSKDRSPSVCVLVTLTPLRI